MHLCDAVQGERHASTRRHEISAIRLQVLVRVITKFLSRNNITVNYLSLLCDERVGHASDGDKTSVVHPRTPVIGVQQPTDKNPRRLQDVS